MQISADAHLREIEYLEVLTSPLRLYSTLKNVSNRKEANLMPKLRSVFFAYPKVPRAATSVTWVLPKGLDTKMEEVDAVPQLQAFHRDVVEVLIKVFDAHDLLTERLGTVGIFLGSGSGGGGLRWWLLLTLFGPELPAVLEFWNAHGFENGIQHGGAAGWRCGCGCLGRARCRQVRSGQCGETTSHLVFGNEPDCGMVEADNGGIEMILDGRTTRCFGCRNKRLPIVDR